MLKGGLEAFKGDEKASNDDWKALIGNGDVALTDNGEARKHQRQCRGIKR